MKNKKLAIALTSISLVAVLAIGGTLAYFSAQTTTKQNTFTMGAGVTGELTEPSWKEENGQNFAPGNVIAKDPMITNLAEETTDPVYVAATISYQRMVNGAWEDCSYADLDKFINIQYKDTSVDPAVLMAGFNTSAWTMARNNTIAYYNNTLAGQQSTAPIFDAVQIDVDGLTPALIDAYVNNNELQFDLTKYEVTNPDETISYTYENYRMYDFQIIVKGYLVQSDGFTSAQEAMLAAFPAVFGTN